MAVLQFKEVHCFQWWRNNMAGYGSCHTLFFHVSLTVWLFVHFFYSIYHCHGYTLSINLVARGRASALHIQTSRLEKRNLICLKVNQLRHTLFFVRPPPLIVSFRELYWVKASFERGNRNRLWKWCVFFASEMVMYFFFAKE